MVRVIGSNIAALVFVELMSHKQKISFFPYGNLGSGWAGLFTQGLLLDLGQRYFELDFENRRQSEIERFDSSKSQRDFVHLIRDFIEGKGYCLERIKVETFFRGVITNCPLETADLSGVMNKLTWREKCKIISELENRALVSDLDMSFVGYKSFEKPSRNLFLMLMHNHGITFNNLLIFPFADKFDVDLKRVPLQLRRKLWLPVFYPNTILEACKGLKIFKPYRPHFKFANGSSSLLIRNIADRLTRKEVAETQNINLEKDCELSDFLSFKGLEKSFVGLSIDRIAKSLNLPFVMKKKKLRLVWLKFCIKDIDREIDFLSVIDADIPFFRVSSSTKSFNDSYLVLCVETCNENVDSKRIFESLVNMGLVRESSDYSVIKDICADVLDEPTFENQAIFDKMVDHIEQRFCGINFELCNLNYANTTLNAQILTAMKLAQETGIE